MQTINIPRKNILSGEQYDKEVEDKQKYLQKVNDAIQQEQDLLDIADSDSDSDNEPLGGRAPGPGAAAEDGKVLVPFNVKYVHQENIDRLEALKQTLNSRVPRIQTEERTFRTLAIVQKEKGVKRRQVWCDRDVPDDNDVLNYHWEIQTKFQPWKPFLDSNGDIIHGIRVLNPNTVHGRVRLVYSDGTNTVLSNIISLDNITRNLTAAAKRSTYKFDDRDPAFRKIVTDVWEKILIEINYPQGAKLAPIQPSRLEGPLSMRVFRDRVWGNKYTPSIFKKFNIKKKDINNIGERQIIAIVEHIHPTIRLNRREKQQTLNDIQTGRNLRLIIPPFDGDDNTVRRLSFSGSPPPLFISASKTPSKTQNVSKAPGAPKRKRIGGGGASKSSADASLGMNSSYSLLRRLSGLDDLLGGNAVQRDMVGKLFYEFPKGLMFKLTPKNSRNNIRYFIRYIDGFHEVIQVNKNGDVKFLPSIDIPSEPTQAAQKLAIEKACEGYYVMDAPFRTWDDDTEVAKYDAAGNPDEAASGNALLALINQGQSSGLFSNAANAVKSTASTIKKLFSGSSPTSPTRRSSRLAAKTPAAAATKTPPPAPKKAPKPKPSPGASKFTFKSRNSFMTWAEKPTQRGPKGNFTTVKYTSNRGDVIFVQPRKKLGEVYVYVSGIGVIQFKNHAKFRGNNGLQNDGPSMQKVGELPDDFWSSRTWTVTGKGAPVDSEVAQIKAEFTAVATKIQTDQGNLPELSKDNMFETTEAVYDSEDMAAAVRPDNAHLSTSESEEEVVPMMSSLQRSNAHFSTSESEEDDVVREMPTGDITKMMSTMPAEWSSTEDELDFAESSAGEEEEEEEKMEFAESSTPEHSSSSMDFAESSAVDTQSETSEAPIMEEQTILAAEHSSSGVDFAESSAVDTQSETSEAPIMEEQTILAAEHSSSGVDFAESSAVDTQSETSEAPMMEEQTSLGLDFAESSAPEQTSSGLDFAESSAPEQTSSGVDFAESSAPEQTSSGVDFAESSAPEQTSSGVDFAESSAPDTHSETSETPILEESSSDSMAFESIVGKNQQSEMEFAESSAPEKTSSEMEFAESSSPEKTSSEMEFAESSAPEKTSSEMEFAESSSAEKSELDFAESSAAETDMSENEL